MAGDWTQSTLGELIEVGEAHLQTGPFGTALQAAEYSSAGVPLISVGEVRDGHFEIGHKTPRVSVETTKRLPRFVLEVGDIVFARKGGVDRNAIVHPPQGGWFLGSDGIRLRLAKKHSSLFFSYQMRSPATRAWLMQNCEGTTMPSLNQQILARVPIVIPPIAEQEALAAVLGALDDKIELNRRMNATLEAMARALFQSWFVDFDPVRAKLDGRLPEHLDATTVALFPAAFEDSKNGHIPRGWILQPVGDVVECVGGGTPSTGDAKYWDGGTFHWTTPKDFSSLQAPVLLDTDRKLTGAGIAKISSGLLPAGTLLMSSRAPVGYLAVAAMPVAINQGFIAMKCNQNASNWFMLNWCQLNMPEIESRATGTTFAEISKQNFRPILVALPPKELMGAFTARVSPLYERIVANLRQSRILATLRDTLLPKLLSGELSVADVNSSMELSASHRGEVRP